MGYTIPKTEPSIITAGDTIQWTIDLSDYPASSWTLKYNLISADDSGHNELITSIADGDTHVISISTDTSGAYSSGDYKLEKYVIDTGDTVRYSLGLTTIRVKPDPTCAVDSRSHNKKVLDAIQSNIENVASKEQQSYSIAGRSLSRYSFEELMSLKDKYEALYQTELQNERIASGESSGRTVKVRFI